jgi:2-dehydro-3-deoxyphosphogalactonate aldolase
VKAWRAVFPRETLFLPVGGIKPDTMKSFVEAGANGFGLGSALFAPGMAASEVAANARRFADAWRTIAPDGR